MARKNPPGAKNPLRIDADLTFRMGSYRASLTGEGPRLRLAIHELVGALALYRALPPRIGRDGRRQLAIKLHRKLLVEGLSLKVVASRVSLGSIGLHGPTGLFAILIGRLRAQPE